MCICPSGYCVPLGGLFLRSCVPGHESLNAIVCRVYGTVSRVAVHGASSQCHIECMGCYTCCGWGDRRGKRIFWNIASTPTTRPPSYRKLSAQNCWSTVGKAWAPRNRKGLRRSAPRRTLLVRGSTGRNLEASESFADLHNFTLKTSVCQLYYSRTVQSSFVQPRPHSGTHTDFYLFFSFSVLP